MFARIELQVREDVAEAVVATVYKVAFNRLTPSLQEKVITVFTKPRQAASPSKGSEYYALTVIKEDGGRLGAEYNEDDAHPTALDMLDHLKSEIQACARADKEGERKHYD